MSQLTETVRDGTETSMGRDARLDRAIGFGGLVVAVTVIVAGLLAQWTGLELLAWLAAGLTVVSMLGVVAVTIRHFLVHEIQPGLGWMMGSWLMMLIGWFGFLIIGGDSAGFDLETLSDFVGSEIVVPAVVFGVAVGLASMGLLRGKVRPFSRSSETAKTGLFAGSALVVLIGLFAWNSSATIQDLERDSGVEVATAEDGTLIVSQLMEIEPIGFEGEGDPQDEGWDDWVVTHEGEVVFGPATFETAEEFMFGPDTVLFEGTETEVSAWLKDEGAVYKDYLVPGLIIGGGVVLAIFAMTLGQSRRRED